MIYPIGTVLTRKDPQGDFMDEVHVVGGGQQLIVESRKEFSGVHELDMKLARTEYDADIPESVRLERPQVVDPGLTPEQVFAQTEREGREQNKTEGKSPKSRTFSGKTAKPTEEKPSE